MEVFAPCGHWNPWSHSRLLGLTDGCIGDNTNKSGNYVRPCVCTHGCTRFVRDHRTAQLTECDRAAKGFAAKLAAFVAQNS